MTDRRFKQTLFKECARIPRALASERRLEIIDVLAQGPRHVDALAAETGMSIANVSQHLQVLRSARLVESERRGTSVFYRLADRSVSNLWLGLRGVAEDRLAEVRQLASEFHSARNNGVVISRDDALSASRKAILLDVRPASEFESGHLQGAINIPIGELPGRMEELPRNRRIIAYCRGIYCLLADEAAELLIANGFDVVRLEGGWPEWQSEGRPVVAGGVN